jgi:hypothetical protein
MPQRPIEIFDDLGFALHDAIPFDDDKRSDKREAVAL